MHIQRAVSDRRMYTGFLEIQSTADKSASADYIVIAHIDSLGTTTFDNLFIAILSIHKKQFYQNMYVSSISMCFRNSQVHQFQKRVANYLMRYDDLELHNMRSVILLPKKRYMLQKRNFLDTEC